jgi:DNA-binding winged helix-turn-helix (wHTH) protein
MRYSFGQYEVDTQRRELRHDGEPRSVEPQVFDVLAYLLQHRDRLVTRRELTGAVWGHNFITSSTLGSRLMAARRAVGDSGSEQSLIRTVHGRGFRFVAPVRVHHGAEALADTSEGAGGSDALFVGREAEVEHLEELLATALRGARRLVFITGEAGIGRTALVEEFLGRARARGGVGVACGQCVDQHGPGEAYMPVLEAVGRLCREPVNHDLIPLLRRHAPSWLAQLPGLLRAGELRALQGRVQGTTRERMLREMVETLEAWAAIRPLVLVVEDLQWSDPSTLHLLDLLARRREAARLLVVGSCRPTGGGAGGPRVRSLVDELSVHGLCSELALHPLTEPATLAYLERRCHPDELPAGLARLVHERAGGNPLFMRSLVDDWVRRGVLSRSEGAWRLRDTPGSLTTEIPLTLRRLIGEQIGQRSPAEGDLLEAASVAGVEFSAGVVAAALGQGVEEVEERCERLVGEGGLLQPREPHRLPDGSLEGRYSFVHHLYREVLYDRIPPGRRARLHRQIGARLEEAARLLRRHPELAGEPGRKGSWPMRDGPSTFPLHVALALPLRPGAP